MRVNSFTIILSLCGLIAASSATLLACNSSEMSNTSNLKPSTVPYIDVPEELPSTGDIIQVLERRNDTIFMGYVNPDETPVSFYDLRHYPPGTLIQLDSVCSDSIPHLSIYITE